MSGFHFNGLPVTAAEVAAILRDRRSEWHRIKLERQRDRDAREGTILRQLWSMIRGRRSVTQPIPKRGAT